MNFSLREWKQFRKLTLLIEGRIDDARRAAPLISALTKLAKQANPNEPDFIDKVVEFDPSGNQKYLVWTIKAMEKNLRNSWSDRLLDGVIEFARAPFGVASDDVIPIQRAAAQHWDEIWRHLLARYGLFKELIQDFHGFVKRKIIRGEETDINKYEDWSHLDIAVERARREVEEKEKQKRLRKSINVIHADDDWFIFEPLTYEASCHYAQRHGKQGTKWCISSDDYPQYWKEFAENDNKFVFVFNSKNRKFSIQNNEWDEPQTIAGHEANAGTTVWDEDDDPMSFSQFKRESGIPTNLVQKIESYYSDVHGLVVQDEMHHDTGPEEDFNLMQNYVASIKEESEAADFAELHVEIYYDDDARDTRVNQVNWSLPIPREFFVTAPDDFTEIENDDLEEDIEGLVNKYGIDRYGGWVSDVRIGHVTDMAVNVDVNFSPEQQAFDDYNEFHTWLSDLANSLERHVFYDPATRPDATELPDLISEILILFKMHTPENMLSIGVEVPEYENFKLDLTVGGAGASLATSPEIKFVDLSQINKKALLDPRWNRDMQSFRADVEHQFEGRLLNWIAEGIASTPEQGELPLSESQEKAKKMARYFILLGKYMRTNFKWKIQSAGNSVLVAKINISVPVMPSMGIWNEKIRVQAVDFMDSNWSAVRQIAAKTIYDMVKDAGPPKVEMEPPASEEENNLTEGKKKRKIRIRFK